LSEANDFTTGLGKASGRDPGSTPATGTQAVSRTQVSSGWTPGPLSLAAFDRESAYLAPGTQSVALFTRLCIDHGEGAFLFDLDGNRYIDLLAGVGVASLGYAHPRYVAALQKQVARCHVGSFTSENRAALVRLLAELAPGDLNRTQLYSSGAEAVEAALRLAKSRTGRTEMVGFWGGFHGKTGGVLPLLSGSFKRAMGPLMPGMYASPFASCARCAFARSFPECGWHCIEFLRRKIEAETCGEIAAILVEPIQGTAGNIVPPPGYMSELRRLANELGALLIADEMITGFGRTGRMFAVEHDGVVPDVITVGKGFGGGFPMSGIIIREEIAFSRPFANPSGSSSSYGGNPMAAAAARVTVETILEEGLVDHSRRLGEIMLREMKSWEGTIPIVSDVRGRGLMLGMDLVVPGTRTLLDKKITRWIFDTLLSRGVIAMIYNPEVRINPPLVIREAEAMEALAAMKGVLREVAERSFP
jgi:4-aminobutyrate aminotransferase/(S)-3-amino-2-methylpropionate transaminase